MTWPDSKTVEGHGFWFAGGGDLQPKKKVYYQWRMRFVARCGQCSGGSYPNKGYFPAEIDYFGTGPSYSTPRPFIGRPFPPGDWAGDRYIGGYQNVGPILVTSCTPDGDEFKVDGEIYNDVVLLADENEAYFDDCGCEVLPGDGTIAVKFGPIEYGCCYDSPPDWAYFLPAPVEGNGAFGCPITWEILMAFTEYQCNWNEDKQDCDKVVYATGFRSFVMGLNAAQWGGDIYQGYQIWPIYKGSICHIDEDTRLVCQKYVRDSGEEPADWDTGSLECEGYTDPLSGEFYDCSIASEFLFEYRTISKRPKCPCGEKNVYGVKRWYVPKLDPEDEDYEPYDEDECARYIYQYVRDVSPECKECIDGDYPNKGLHGFGAYKMRSFRACSQGTFPETCQVDEESYKDLGVRDCPCTPDDVPCDASVYNDVLISLNYNCDPETGELQRLPISNIEGESGNGRIYGPIIETNFQPYPMGPGTPVPVFGPLPPAAESNTGPSVVGCYPYWIAKYTKVHTEYSGPDAEIVLCQQSEELDIDGPEAPDDINPLPGDWWDVPNNLIEQWELGCESDCEG